ncbi:MAG: DUF1361 domain-containing protein [Bacteroidota bacterium]
MYIDTFKLNRFLILFSGFCIFLLITRVVITSHFFYSFLVWNLFLAIVPYVISSWLLRTQWIRKHNFPLLIVLGIWLLFLPNAPYIITDLIHLTYSESAWNWLDPFMLFAFALNGLLLGILSLQHIFQVLTDKWNKTTAKRMLFCVVFLCGFGIYLGRFLRWNSWEFFSDPLLFVKECFVSLTHPWYRTRTWGMTLGFGMFLWILFLGIQACMPIKKASRE